MPWFQAKFLRRSRTSTWVKNLDRTHRRLSSLDVFLNKSSDQLKLVDSNILELHKWSQNVRKLIIGTQNLSGQKVPAIEQENDEQSIELFSMSSITENLTKVIVKLNNTVHKLKFYESNLKKVALAVKEMKQKKDNADSLSKTTSDSGVEAKVTSSDNFFSDKLNLVEALVPFKLSKGKDNTVNAQILQIACSLRKLSKGEKENFKRKCETAINLTENLGKLATFAGRWLDSTVECLEKMSGILTSVVSVDSEDTTKILVDLWKHAERTNEITSINMEFINRLLVSVDHAVKEVTDILESVDLSGSRALSSTLGAELLQLKREEEDSERRIDANELDNYAFEKEEYDSSSAGFETQDDEEQEPDEGGDTQVKRRLATNAESPSGEIKNSDQDKKETKSTNTRSERSLKVTKQNIGYTKLTIGNTAQNGGSSEGEVGNAKVAVGSNAQTLKSAEGGDQIMEQNVGFTELTMGNITQVGENATGKSGKVEIDVGNNKQNMLSLAREEDGFEDDDERSERGRLRRMKQNVDKTEVNISNTTQIGDLAGDRAGDLDINVGNNSQIMSELGEGESSMDQNIGSTDLAVGNTAQAGETAGRRGGGGGINIVVGNSLQAMGNSDLAEISPDEAILQACCERSSADMLQNVGNSNITIGNTAQSEAVSSRVGLGSISISVGGNQQTMDGTTPSGKSRDRLGRTIGILVEEESDEESDGLLHFHKPIFRQAINRNATDDAKIKVKVINQTIDLNATIIKDRPRKHLLEETEWNRCSNKECEAFYSYLDTVVEDRQRYHWKCQFCSTVMKLKSEPDLCNIPTTPDALYLAADQAKIDKDRLLKIEDHKIIFVVDTTEFMSTTLKIRFRNSSSVDRTRLKHVQLALINLLQQINVNDSARRIALVTFHKTVTIHSSGRTINIAQDDLTDPYLLKSKGRDHSTIQTIGDSHWHLKAAIERLNCDGATDLGSAILVALGMVNNSRGSKILIFCGGETNPGTMSARLVKTGKSEQTSKFYQQISEKAKVEECSISTFTFTRRQLSVFEMLARETGGIAHFVSPTSAYMPVKEELSKTIIATKATVKLLVPKSINFLENDLTYQGGKRERKTNRSITTVRNVGNISDKGPQVVSVEFSIPQDFQSTSNTVPVQAQISYIDSEGTQWTRVLTTERPMNRYRDVADSAMY